ncbi:MAG: HDIG domain-containing protein, partial [Clostridia bacterium]|nr:HDIG domain-containing protein [Clostridia bacterium]
ANTHLARAAAYYHDIGKLKNPVYFKENQMDGHNPHDEITPELSTALIKKHVSNGMLIAKEYHLPEKVAVFITEHHGTMPIQFFYSKAQKYTDGRLDDTGFRYDGPTPTSKIAAILMICDSSEAALRALSVDNRMKAEEIVGNIINDRLKYKQFDNCDITMQELNIIKETIVSVYIGISHKRMAYPDQKKENESIA